MKPIPPLRLYVSAEEFDVWGQRPECAKEGHDRTGRALLRFGLPLVIVREPDRWQRAVLNWRQYPGHEREARRQRRQRRAA